MYAKNDTNVLLTELKTMSPLDISMPREEDTDWGVDTINLSFPVFVEACSEDASIWSKSNSTLDLFTDLEYNQLKGFHKIGHGDVRVTLNLTKERCYLEFNASRLISGKSRQLLHPDALESLVGALISELQYAVIASFDVNPDTGVLERERDWSSKVRVSRLDLARNLYIPHSIQSLKHALSEAKPKYGKTKIEYENTNGGWTLVNGTNSTGQDRIYDKTKELSNYEVQESIHQDARWFRFETQLQKSRLKSFGLNTLKAVNSRSSWQAIAHRWEACNWDVAISEPGTLEKALESLPPKRQKDVAGFLVMSSFGTEKGLTVRYQAEMRALCNELGLNPGLDIYEQGASSMVLDLLEGGLVDTPTL